MDLSVIILSFKSKDQLQVTLDAVFNSQTNYSYEVIVVDNDSKDGTAEMVEKKFPAVRLIRNQNNGFAKGNNVGIKAAKGEYLLLLNPDTAVDTDVFQKCIDLLKARPDIGMVGPKLVKGDGSLDLAGRRNVPNLANSFFHLTRISSLFPNSHIFSSYNRTYTSEDEESEVGSISGAFIMTSRKVVDKIGLLDESMFMYAEDTDWCLRCTEAGYKVWYYPRARVMHYKGSSSKKTPFIALYWWHQSAWIFYKKHYSSKYPFFVNWLVWLGIWGRFATLYVINKFRKSPYVSK